MYWKESIKRVKWYTLIACLSGLSSISLAGNDEGCSGWHLDRVKETISNKKELCMTNSGSMGSRTVYIKTKKYFYSNDCGRTKTTTRKTETKTICS